MADFSISGRTTVKGLKNQFRAAYGLTLRVYKGKKFAEENATLSSLSEKKIDDIAVRSNLLIGNFEKVFEAATGLTVQVATPDDSILINNASTLGKARDAYKK